MKLETYFKKFGEIYGIESTTKFPFEYVTEVLKFTDWEQAEAWTKAEVETFRELTTKTDALHHTGVPVKEA